MRQRLFIPVLAGIATGLLSTYPIQLRFLPSIIFWGIVGLALGFFVSNRRETVWSGVLFGIFLTFSFMLSRFGGMVKNLPGYLIFTALLSILAIVSGTAAIFVGSKLKQFIYDKKQKQQ